MIIDDFVMLGKTVPETVSDGRQFVCTAGFSFELKQAIRVYPMARIACPRRWSVSRLPLERNPKDSRHESWKIRGDRRPGLHDQINSVITPIEKTISAEKQREIVSALAVPSLKQANEERRSLCILLPAEVPCLRFESGETAEMAPTPDLFGNIPDLPVKERFKWHPRIEFTDEKGDKHDLMLRDWGCYELMRKRGDPYGVHWLEEALNLLTAPPLLCGNLNRFRNSWLVISVLQGAVHARPMVCERQSSLFDAAEFDYGRSFR
jgi:hypothetical protein